MSAEAAIDGAVVAGDEAPDSAAIEADARGQGWRSLDEYTKSTYIDKEGNERTRDPSKWIDAETFLKVGRTRLPVVQERNRKLEAELREIKQSVRDLLTNQKADRDKAIADAIANLTAQKHAAVLEADALRVVALDTQIEKLREAPIQATKPVGSELPAEFFEWEKANPWFNKRSRSYDPAMAGMAIGYFDMLSADEETAELPDGEKLKLVTAEMRKRFSEKFANPNRKAAAIVEGNGAAPRGAAKHTYSDLPPEAKELCDRFVRQKVLTREQYVEQYPW